MNILHVIPSLATASGGPAFALMAFCEATPPEHSITIISTKEGGAETVDFTGLPHVQVKRFAFAGRHSFKFSPGLFHWFFKHSHEFDAVHAHAAFSLTTDICSVFAVFTRQKLIYRPLGTLAAWSLSYGLSFFKQLYLLLFLKPVLRRAKAIHCTSLEEASGVKSLVSNARTAVLPIPFSGEFAASPRKRNGYIRFGFLSRLDPKKNLELLISAFTTADFPAPVSLHIAGSGDSGYETDLKALVNKGNSENIVFEGFIPPERKSTFLDSIDFLILPSSHENFGIASLEAMARGVPVLLSDAVFIDLPQETAGVFRFALQLEPIQKLLLDVERVSTAEYAVWSASVIDAAKAGFSPAAISPKLVALYA